jgi:hypothetical protein
MTICSTLVNDALQFIGVSSSIMPADPDQQQRAFTTLKRLFDDLPTKLQVYLPLRRPASISADLFEPLYATESLAIILGRHVAPYFEAELSPSKLELYDEAVKSMRWRSKRPTVKVYSGRLALPQGEWFYPGQDAGQYTIYDSCRLDQVKFYEFDFSDEVSRRNTSLTSVTMESIGEADATISSETLSGNVKRFKVTYSDTGRVIIRGRALFASTETFDNILQADVYEYVNESEA